MLQIKGSYSLKVISGKCLPIFSILLLSVLPYQAIHSRTTSLFLFKYSADYIPMFSLGFKNSLFYLFEASTIKII